MNIRFRYWLLLVTSVALVSPLLAQESAPVSAAAVPAAVLDRLRAQYIPEDDKSADLSENDKIRRYQSILREGGWAERQHPGATNLYQVREYLMAAARGIALLSPSDEAEQQLQAIARRQLNSTAPPEPRMLADLILSRQQLGNFTDEPLRQLETIQTFLGHYSNSTVAAKSLMIAVDLIKLVNVTAADKAAANRVGALEKMVLNRLESQHRNEPGVLTVLEMAGLRSFYAQPVKGRLKMLDGSTITLPRDILGRVTVLQFWVAGRDGLKNTRRPWNELPVSIAEMFKRQYQWHTLATLEANGVEFIGLNLDTNRAMMDEALKTLNLPWRQAYNGLGKDDPLFDQRQMRPPAFWCLSADGRQFINSAFDNLMNDPKYLSEAIGNFAANTYDITLRIRYYRSGEFLLDEPAVFPTSSPAEHDVPADKLEALRSRVCRSPWITYTPPATNIGWVCSVRQVTAVAEADKKAESLQQALALGRAIEQEYPRAANLTLVRNWMLVAARWLANQRHDAAAAQQARTTAGAILASRPADGPALLARYVQLSDQLAQDDRNAPARIADFRQTYAKSDLNWAVDMFAILLAVECAEEPTRVAWCKELPDRYPAPHPKMRGFLRDFCAINVDAASSPYSALERRDPPMTLPARRLALADKPLTAELPLLNGGLFRLPSTDSKRVALHFWTVAAPPTWPPNTNTKWSQNYIPSADLVVVGVNLDQDRVAVQEYLKHRPDLANWIHVFSGRGWTEPLARELDLYTMPRTILLGPGGTIEQWGYAGEFDVGKRR